LCPKLHIRREANGMMINRRWALLCLSGILLPGVGPVAETTQHPSAEVPSENTGQPTSRIPHADIAGSAGKDCKFRTHNCEICTQENEKVTCSSVGIACEPTEWRCLNLQAPQK
jgi:hypothetical protein